MNKKIMVKEYLEELFDVEIKHGEFSDRYKSLVFRLSNGIILHYHFSDDTWSINSISVDGKYWFDSKDEKYFSDRYNELRPIKLKDIVVWDRKRKLEVLNG
jgi:hypothetical protein